ncbi:MAG: S26 family signal peptidase [Thermoplasmata archaeon]
MPESNDPTPALGVPSSLRRRRWWSTRRVVVRDESMLPALRPGDRLLVDRHAYRGRAPHVGEIVVVADPEEPSRWLVKRVARILLSSDPTAAGVAIRSPSVDGNEGFVFVLSDAPGPTRDSRTFGPVAVDRLIGHAYRRYFPADRRGPL